MSNNSDILERFIYGKGGSPKRGRWQLNTENLDELMNEARKDERDTLIGEIEKWANETIEFRYASEFIATELLPKLNELRKEGLV